MRGDRRRRLTGLVALLVLASGWAAAPGSAAQPPAAGDCGRHAVLCSQVTVPLDRSGQTPGSVSLHVEELKAAGPERGVMFLLAGGPGQAATDLFDFGAVGAVWQRLFPGYTLVAFDVRGSGHSDALSCPAAAANAWSRARIAACLQQLGPNAGFYRTADNAADIDAVREALGFQQISIWGVSYGSELALAYAEAFPTRVQRLLLDSVASPLDRDPFAASTIGAIPSTLRAFCAAGACRGSTSHYPAEVVALANALAVKPIHGLVRRANGGARSEHLNGAQFLALVVQTDLDPGLAAELPAAVHAARLGDPRPLLRLVDLVRGGDDDGLALNNLLYLATNCGDGPLPWSPDTPVEQRPPLLTSAVAALPPGSFGGFGSWAATLGNAEPCLDWPVTTASQAVPASGSFPDVPVLALSGTLDLRTPTGAARAVVARFGHGQLLTVSNTGHSALTSADTPCVITAVHDWLDRRTIPHSCSAPRLLEPLSGFPAAATPRRARTVTLAPDRALVARTIHEAEATWLLTLTEDGWRPGSAAGLVSGKLTASYTGFTLSHYSVGDGLFVSGHVHATLALHRPLEFGTLRVSGRGTAPTTLYLTGDELVGNHA